MGLNSSDNIFADPEALQAYSDQLRRSLPPADKVKIIRAPARRRQLELQFYIFAKDVYQFIGKAGNSAAIVSVVLGALYEAYFRNFKCNPVRLTSCGLKQRGLSRYQKLRSLRLLAKAGFITIHQKPGKNPLVTLKVDLCSPCTPPVQPLHTTCAAPAHHLCSPCTPGHFSLIFL